MPIAIEKKTGALASHPGTRPHRTPAQQAVLAFMRLRERVLDTLWIGPRNKLYGHFLEADAITIGRAPRIRGRGSIQIGEKFVALDNLWLEAIDYLDGYQGNIIIGSRVTCGNSVHIAATNLVSIGNDVLMGSRVMITDHNHGIYNGNGQSSPEQLPSERVLSKELQTVVDDKVWIGDGVVLLAGSYIGRGSIIGANSVVRGYIPAASIAAGNPAKVIKKYSFELKEWSSLH